MLVKFNRICSIQILKVPDEDIFISFDVSFVHFVVEDTTQLIIEKLKISVKITESFVLLQKTIFTLFYIFLAFLCS